MRLYLPVMSYHQLRAVTTRVARHSFEYYAYDAAAIRRTLFFFLQAYAY